MRIYTKQIDEASLTAFVTGAMGASLSGQLNSYLNAGGYLGANVVYASGGTQTISGTKTFDASPGVPYSGGTGAAPSRLYVDNQIIVSQVSLNSQISGMISGLTGSLVATGALLSAVRATGSSIIQNVNLSGLGGTIVLLSGGYVLISGAAGGAGGSNNGDGINLSGNLSATGNTLFQRDLSISGQLSSLRVTGSSNIAFPNLSGIGGTIVLQSGSFVLVSGGGGGGASTLSVTGSNPITAPNFTGVGGVLMLQSGNFVLVSGNTSAIFNTINTYNITGTGNINITNISSGSMSNTFNVSGTFNNNPTILNGITGNFVNMSFYFDEFNLATGLNLVEGFVARDFTCTGYAIGAYVSGTHGSLTGSLYQRNTSNIKTEISAIYMQSGMYFTGVGGLTKTISGMHRVGIDIFRIPTGATGVTIGLFGVGN